MQVEGARFFIGWESGILILSRPVESASLLFILLLPLVASVPETDALRYPARNLVSPTPLLVVPLPIAAPVRPPLT